MKILSSKKHGLQHKPIFRNTFYSVISQTLYTLVPIVP